MSKQRFVKEYRIVLPNGERNIWVTPLDERRLTYVHIPGVGHFDPQPIRESGGRPATFSWLEACHLPKALAAQDPSYKSTRLAEYIEFDKALSPDGEGLPPATTDQRINELRRSLVEGYEHTRTLVANLQTVIMGAETELNDGKIVLNSSSYRIAKTLDNYLNFGYINKRDPDTRIPTAIGTRSEKFLGGFIFVADEEENGDPYPAIRGNQHYTDQAIYTVRFDIPTHIPFAKARLFIPEGKRK